jgi:hypothetical protein
MRGTQIKHNFIHDVLGYGRENGTGRWKSPDYSWGIYLDDGTCGVTFTEILSREPNWAAFTFTADATT